MRNFKKLIAVVSALALLLTVFSGINMFVSADYDAAKELADFKAAMETKVTLAPGTYVEAGDTEYYHGMLRSREGPNGVVVDVNADFDAYAHVATIPVGIWGHTHPAGSLFGIPVSKAVTSSRQELWLGTSTVYNVVPGTYVAAVVNASQDNIYGTTGLGLGAEFANGYRYEVSSDGETWTTLTATIRDAHGWTQNHSQAAYAVAVVQIPAGAKYYRITCPGFDTARINNTLSDAGLYTASGYVGQFGTVSGFTPAFNEYGIGSVIASACDLTAVADYTAITDYTHVSAEVRAFQKEMASKPVLAAGVYDDLSTADYYYAMNVAPQSWPNSDSTPGVDGYFSVVDARGSAGVAPTVPFGTFFGVENRYGRFNQGGWNGYFAGAVCYNVNAGDYVATAVLCCVDNADEAQYFATEYWYQASANGATWTNLTPTIIDVCENWNEKNNQLAYGTAVVQIPEGMRYYRVIVGGSNKAVMGTDFYSPNNVWQNYNNGPFPQDIAYKIGYGVGGSIASSANLAEYTSMADIPGGYTVTAPAGVTVSKTENVKNKETITITVADNLVAGSLKANGVAVFAKGDTDEAGKGAGNVFEYTLTANADVVITAEFKDAADFAAEDNFATVAASINTDTRALRFLNRVYVDGDKIRIGEELYTIKSVGALIVPEYMLTDWDYTAEDLDHSKVDDGEVYAVDVAVNVLYDKTAKYVDFTTGVKGLAEYTQVEDILVRAYVIYEDANGAEQYAYADVQRANYAALNGGETTPEA